jgi:predicted DNA-binding transcriptional regulator AlpA
LFLGLSQGVFDGRRCGVPTYLSHQRGEVRPEFQLGSGTTRMSTNRALSDVRPVPRRGLSHDEAAMYIGVSAGKFDELVADGRMPKPVKIDKRSIWDIRALDLAFDALAEENSAPNSWEGV